MWSCDLSSEPSLIFSKCINESISSVDCGVITTAASEDVIVSSFSGKVVAFSSAFAEAATVSGPSAKEDNKKEKRKDDDDEKGTIKRVTDKDVAKLNVELQALRAKLEKEKEKYSVAAVKESGVATELIATQNNTRMKESFVLDQEDACYVLTVEIESAIDCVIIQSTAMIELVDMDSNVAIVSKTAIPENGERSTLFANQTFVQCRCPADFTTGVRCNQIGSGRTSLWPHFAARNPPNGCRSKCG